MQNERGIGQPAQNVSSFVEREDYMNLRTYKLVVLACAPSTPTK